MALGARDFIMEKDSSLISKIKVLRCRAFGNDAGLKPSRWSVGRIVSCTHGWRPDY